MVSGALVSAGAMIDYVQRGGLLRFGGHLLMATAFPLTASKALLAYCSCSCCLI
jgi:hypothetical protein